MAIKAKLTPTPNGDEALPYIGNFHKSLLHNAYGEVDAAIYNDFKQRCLDIDAGQMLDFESFVPSAMQLQPPFAASADPFAALADPTDIGSLAKFTSPLAGAATETLGPSPKALEMPPAPAILSASTAAEMVELYWMALLRDIPLAEYASNTQVQEAISDIRAAYAAAIVQDTSDGALKLGQDLPKTAGGALDIRLQTLFRCGLPGEEFGPLISQFFLRDIPYGVQTISTKQVPYIREKDFLTNYDDWLRAQNTGKDKWGRDYGTCNNYADQAAGRETYYPDTKRHISTMRDLARFVNRDALHQAYFNAALFLDAIGAPLDKGNPYNSSYKRQGGFATLGGPDLLTLVSEAASRALKVVWRQKWLVHRRCRPEVYGGLIQMEREGVPAENLPPKPYGLNGTASQSSVAGKIKNQFGTYFLPMAFSAGSPNHPAYGAGHATVAGACVTLLKAWFDEDKNFLEAICEASAKEPGAFEGLLQPGAHTGEEIFKEPERYVDSDAKRMTVGGELNKLASNVAMGRSMGGVHWRSDNTRSLRLGEQIACHILRKRKGEYFEKPVSFSFRSFDGGSVTI